MALAFHAAGHHGRLRGVEAADCAAGDGDEEQRPDGEARGIGVHEKVGVGQDRPVTEQKRPGQPEGHDQQEDGKERIDAADDGVDGQDGGEEIVDEDDRRPQRDVPSRHVGEQGRRAEHEDRADHDHEDDGEDFHEMPHARAEIAADDLGIGRAAVAQ